MVKRVVEVAGAINILVNNAGFFDLGPLFEITTERYEKVFAVNVEVSFSLSRPSRHRWSGKDAVAKLSTCLPRQVAAGKHWPRSIVQAKPL